MKEIKIAQLNVNHLTANKSAEDCIHIEPIIDVFETETNPLFLVHTYFYERIYADYLFWCSVINVMRKVFKAKKVVCFKISYYLTSSDTIKIKISKNITNQYKYNPNQAANDAFENYILLYKKFAKYTACILSEYLKSLSENRITESKNN